MTDILKIKNHHYALESDDEKETKTIYFPANNSWSDPGGKAYSITDSGNGYKLKDHWTGQVISIDYGQAQMVKIMLELFDGVQEYEIYTKRYKYL